MMKTKAVLSLLLLSAVRPPASAISSWVEHDAEHRSPSLPGAIARNWRIRLCECAGSPRATFQSQTVFRARDVDEDAYGNILR
jgi:hypothetical protein